ncbi:hypothetical protein AB0Y14_03360 [Rothia sp. HC945]
MVLEEDLDGLHQAGDNQPQTLERNEYRQYDNRQRRALRGG